MTKILNITTTTKIPTTTARTMSRMLQERRDGAAVSLATTRFTCTTHILGCDSCAVLSDVDGQSMSSAYTESFRWNKLQSCVKSRALQVLVAVVFALAIGGGDSCDQSTCPVS